MKRLFNWLRAKLTIRRRILLTAIAIIVVVVNVGSILAWEYTNSSKFCTVTCHQVHPEEAAAYKDSYHARVRCTECHMGRVSVFQAMGLKVTHVGHLYALLTGHYERPLWSVSMRPARESCERCHWPPAFHDDTVREIKRFAPDEANTETRIYLILHTGGGSIREGQGLGIHWHVENKVTYIATDERRQNIPWVQAVMPDGRVVEYNDVVNPLSAERIASAPKRVMTCVDCHNRVGHPFYSPDTFLDQALALHRIDKNLPEIKARGLRLLATEYANRQDAEAALDAFYEEYKRDYPEVVAANPEALDQARQALRELLGKVTFEELGVTWRSFPNNGGHKDFPGCFRCHDGQHLDAEGNSIRLHCNICHAIPMQIAVGERPPEMPASTLRQPSFHLAANFMAEHRFLANDSCAKCHGEVKFGTAGGSFCANPACHGTKWPSVNLDAAFPHPIPLEGKHAQVWCNNCHNGNKKPAYVCSNCHQPPGEIHFGTDCGRCHTPDGWAKAEVPADFVHPLKLTGRHSELHCRACHEGNKELKPVCSTCHEPPVPVHFKSGCEKCHSPEGWKQSALAVRKLSPPIPHAVDGNELCLRCHDQEGIKPIPINDKKFPHEEYSEELCILCHRESQ